jgi:hypothetical protein
MDRISEIPLLGASLEVLLHSLTFDLLVAVIGAILSRSLEPKYILGYDCIRHRH